MTRVNVDNQVTEVQVAETTDFSQLLKSALEGVPSNRIVTQILIDGQAIDKNTAQQAAPQAHAVRELEIRTVDKEIWALNGLDIAISAIERVQRSLIKAAELFRESDLAIANRFFVQCVDGLERFYESIVITRSALPLPFAQIEFDGMKLAVVEKDFSGILSHIIAAQEAKNYPAVADRVEYELLPNLASWSRMLRAMRNSQSSNA